MIGKISAIYFLIHFFSLNIVEAGVYKQYCEDYYWYNFNDGNIQQLYLNSDSQYSSDQEMRIGLGLWFSYRPLDEQQYEQIDTNQNIIRLFLLKFQDLSYDGSLFFCFIEMNIELESIELVIYVQTQNGYQRHTILIENFTFDGDWSFIYFYIDQSKEIMTAYYYSNNNQQYSSIQIDDLLVISPYDFLVTTTKYLLNEYINNQYIATNALPGIILELIQTTENFFSDFQGFQEDCLPQTSCQSVIKKLVSNNFQFTGLNSITQASNQLENNYFSISGWAKQDTLVKDMNLDSLLMRITSNEQFFDDSQIGDRLLYVIYHQSQILSQNGFTFETYSYNFPIKLNSYNTQQSDVIQFLQSELSDVQTNWHFFQYYEGSIENNGFPFVRIYYPTKEQTYTYKWNKDIRHFTNVKLYFHIGGDDYFQNQFKGYLSDWKIKTYCQKFEIKLDIPCHYTCLTCKGISASDCLSCQSNSNRLFSQDENKCICPIQFVDIPDQSYCQFIEGVNGVFQVSQFNNQCDSLDDNCEAQNQECQYGYFPYNQQCIQWYFFDQNKSPHFDEYQSEYLIKCLDCYLFPEGFSSNPSCTFNFLSSSVNSPYIYQMSSYVEQEAFRIKESDQNSYFLQLISGAYIYLGEYFCKPGYYENQSKVCSICPIGCQNCHSSSSCLQCFIGYYMNEENQCVHCNMCHACEFKDEQEFCYYSDNCTPTQYWFNNKCFDCGEYCQNCSVDQCYYCIDNQKYYISLDGINCSLCSIQNCKYCFEYYKINDILFISLDIIVPQNFDRSFYQITNGCAQCYDGFYYSFVSQECELKPVDENNCQVGLIVDELGKKICLKSQTLTNSIQTTQCINGGFCLECIQDYTQTIKSFCIICQDGYYSSVMTGQCKLCPLGCRTCGQQHKNFQDWWKWDIKAFYKYFANSDGTHSFEANAAVLDVDSYQISCLSCAKNYILYNNTCLQGCDDECFDCVIKTDIFPFPPYSSCNRCKSTINNKQRALQITFTNLNSVIAQCLQCAPFCEACYPRTKDQISSINPFFDQYSKYLVYTNICFKYSKNSQFQPIMIPKYMNPQICQNQEKCTKLLKINFKVFCDMNQYYQAMSGETNESIKDTILYIYYMMITTPFSNVEQPQIYDYLNNNMVQVLQYKFVFQAMSKQFSCFTDSELTSRIITNIRKYVFYINFVSIEIIGETQNILYYLSKLLTVTNFDKILFQNFSFLTPIKDYFNPLQNQKCELQFINDYVPIELIFLNCNFTQSAHDIYIFFSMSSNQPKIISFMTMWLIDLKILDSSMFDLQPQGSYNNSIFNIQDFTITNSFFSNTSIFSFKAVNNSLNYIINMTSIKLFSTNFSNSNFFNSTFKLTFDIGIVNLQDIYLENVIFENNSIFLFTFAAQQINCKNIILKNVKFYDNSSFIFSNTFQINTISFLSCYIEQGFFITNNGNYSKSTLVITNSNNLLLENVIFDNIAYISEKSFIYIIQGESNSLQLTIIKLMLNDCKYIDSQLGQFSFGPISYKFSLIYLECANCILESIEIIRGFGRPEISIVQSQNLQIKNLYITLKKEYYQKSLHSSLKCVKQFNQMDMSFVLFISQYNFIDLQNILIEKMLIFDHSIIQIEGLSLNEEQNNQDNILINNSIFRNNILIITQLNRFTSIISISSQQSNNVLIQNSEFSNNLVNKYEDDAQMHSSTTLLIEFQIGQVKLKNTTFYQNVIYNSSDSILYIKTSTLILDYCKFQGSNIFNAEILSKNILLKNNQGSDLNQTFQQLFLAQSQGGSGYFLQNQLSIQNCFINNSNAVNGGGFYIITGSKGLIEINNSTFLQVSTLLTANTFSSGGAFYIDATKSQLNISITNSYFDQAHSRTFGGVIYIDTSKINNQIMIKNVSFIACFSFQHSVISFQPSQLQQLRSSLTIIDSYFSNSKQNYELYISKIHDFLDLNIEGLQYSNPLIYSQYCNITIYNCQFQQIHLANLIQIEKGINVMIEQVVIENCTILYAPLIQISHRENLKSSINFKNIKVTHVSEFILDKNITCVLQTSNNIEEILCPNSLYEIKQNQPSININETINLNNCSLQKVYTTQLQSKLSFIIFKGFQNDDDIELSNIQLKNNLCSICYFGLINIVEYNFTDNFLMIKYVEIENNVCGFLGCLSIFYDFNNSYLFNTDSSLRLLRQNDYMNLEFQVNFAVQFKVLESFFINNTAHYGAACFFASTNIFLQNCFFKSNQAYQKGGAIYFYSKNNKIFLTNSQIVDNEAQIAGGLYYNQNQIQQENHFNLVLNKNFAQQFANNILSIPSKLALNINGVIQCSKNEIQNSTTIIDVVTIIPYYILGSQTRTQNLLLPSGLILSNYQYFDAQQSIYIPYNFSLRLIASNQKNEQNFDLSGSSCKVYSEVINNDTYSFQQFKHTEGTLSQQIINFNSTTGDYNMDNLIIYFNPKTEASTQLQLAFQCDSIQIPQYNLEYPYELQNIISNYYLVLKLRTFECQLGEYLNKTSGGCVQCDIQQNQYSITKDSTQCEFKDEVKMRNIKSAMIDLREGYWRAFYNSRIIEECYHLELNCLGGWIAGDDSCYIGHIGALCEQCDIYNIRGFGSYSQSQNYSCSNCTKMATNILNIILAFLWTLLSIFLSVNSTIKMIDEFIMYTKLKAFGKYLIFQAAQISILIKVFTNYLQIINSLATFQLTIPIGISVLFQSVGNPIETVSFSLDCYFVQFTNLTIIYVRILWGFAQVGIFISLFLILHLIITILNKQKMSLTYLTTTLIYIYIYLSPNIVSGLIALMSYRTISGEKWVTSNVSYLYENQQHFEWLVYFILPAFILVSILIPFFFFSILFYHRKKIHISKIRKVWGYLYNEYKQETYYWEIIKIAQKELIILVLVYYVDYVSIKSSLIFFLLYLYGYLTTKYRPYQTGDLNQIDSFQTSICKISIILAQTIYSAQNLGIVEIQGPFYLFLTIVNFIFIVQIVSKIFFAYFDKLHQQIDYLKAKILLRFPYIIKSNKFCIKIFQNTTERKQIIRQRFLLIKCYLVQQAKQIIIYKKLNNMDNLSPKNSKDLSSGYFGQTPRYTSRALRINTARHSKMQLSLKFSEQ